MPALVSTLAIVFHTFTRGVGARYKTSHSTEFPGKPYYFNDSHSLHLELERFLQVSLQFY